MKNKMKYVFIPLFVFALASCNRPIDDLYAPGQYETGSFERNFYSERGDFDSKFKDVKTTDIEVTPELYGYHNDFTEDEMIELREEDRVNRKGEKLSWQSDDPKLNTEDGYGPYNSLLNNSTAKFTDGYVSKLYDGRVRCDGLVTKSRVQVDKRGYAAYFPKALSLYKYFGLALRGATEDGNTDFAKEAVNPQTEKERLDKHYPIIDMQISFVMHSTESGEYSKVNFNVRDYHVRTNDYYTAFCFFYFDDVLYPTFGGDWYKVLKDTIAMSYTFTLKNQVVTGKQYTDDSTDKEKDHFAVMLYEVMLPGSVWY